MRSNTPSSGNASFAEVIKNIQFLFLWISQTFSQFGDRIFLLFMVELITKNQFSNSAISGLIMIYTIPAIIFGSVAGVFVDRWNKKWIMIMCNLIRAVCVLLLLVSDSVWNIYIMTFLVSTFTQFFAPAEASTIPMLIEKKNLLPANSLFMGTMFSSVVFGFALGTPIISQFSHLTTTLSIFSMYFIAGMILFFLHKQKEQEHEQKHFFHEFKEGYNYVIKNQIVLFCIIRQVIVFSAFAALSVLVIGFVNDILHLKPVFFGYLLAVAGLGMGLGALATGKFANRLGKDRLIFSGFIISSVMLVCLACTNFIAWGVGLEKTEQQKELYTSLSILNKNGSRTNTISKLNILLSPDSTGEQSVSSRTKIENLSDEQVNILSDFLNTKNESLLSLKKDEKTKKINLGKLVNSLAKEEIIFLKSDKQYVKVVDTELNKVANNSKAFKFFLKLQNEYIIKDLLKSVKFEDKPLNAIMILTENKIENIDKLRSFLKLNEDGIPTTTLSQSVSELPSQVLKDLSELLEIELEDFSNPNTQNFYLGSYLNKMIKEDASNITIKKANAIKTIISDPNNSIIKLLIKQEASYFEIILAFLITIIVGFGSAISAIPLQTTLQEVVEEKVRGKVFGVQNMFISLAMTVPMGLSGFLADILDGKILHLKGVSVVMIMLGIFIFFGGFVENMFKQKK